MINANFSSPSSPPKNGGSLAHIIIGLFQCRGEGRGGQFHSFLREFVKHTGIDGDYNRHAVNAEIDKGLFEKFFEVI